MANEITVQFKLEQYQVLLQPILNFLGCATPQAWVNEAINHMPLIIQDHANCEKKAASTALNLMFRYNFFTELQVRLSQLVREEMLHFEQVLDIMKSRKQEWMSIPAGRYAHGLRKHVRTYEPEAMIDVLIIGAFVEARSCERFAALAPFVDEELGKYYLYLLKSESRHFEDYIVLAKMIAQHDEVEERIAFFKEIEQALIETQDDEMRFHSGVPAAGLKPVVDRRTHQIIA